MDRRSLATYVAASLTASVMARGAAASGTSRLDEAVGRYLALPGTKSFRVFGGTNGVALRIEHQPYTPLFIASAYKTFILAQYLRAAEAGFVTEDQSILIDDNVRTFGSPVFHDLAGKTPAVSVLEAMMSHSDNLATDAATLKIGIDYVRALVAEAGLKSVRIPASTRRLASYLFGAPYGVDIGWTGIQAALSGHLPGTPRPALNDRETIRATACDMVSWYESALRGTFFAQQDTITEFKRLHGLSIQIPKILPPGSVAYVKGGEANNLFGFFAKSMAGQTIVNGRTPITFCFLVNWKTADGTDFLEIEARYFSAVAAILDAVKHVVS